VLQADGSLIAPHCAPDLADAAERRWLEAPLHPLIGEEIVQYLARAESPYTIWYRHSLVGPDSTG
jgi:dephospho-CoA kinase